MLVATGAMDSQSTDALYQALDQTAQAGHHVMFLDLTEVPTIDVAGLDVLRDVITILKRGWLGIIGANAQINEQMESRGLAPHPNLRLFENRQAARVATGERAST
jgi:anti-anti-sigma regulatory factor